MGRCLAILLLWLMCAGVSSAQNVPMVHFGIEQGLPSNKIYSIYRDNKGFIWVTTDKGIARFNGITFEVFTTFNGLADNEVFSMQEDALGRLWVAAYNGELCYYKDGMFHTAANTAFLRIPFKTYHILDVIPEKDKSVSVLYNKAGYFLNIQGEHVTVVHIMPLNAANGMHYLGKVSANIYSFARDSIGYIQLVWIDSDGKVVKKEKVNDKCYLWFHMLHNQEQRYFMVPDTIYSLDFKPVSAYHNPLNLINAIHNIYFDRGNKFFATRHGLVINDSIVLKQDNNVTGIVNDKKGHYWISTLESGIYCFDTGLGENMIYDHVYTNEIKNIKTLNNHIFFTTASNDLYTFYKGTVKKIIDYSKGRKKYDFPNMPFLFIDYAGTYYDMYNDDMVIYKGLLSNRISHHAYKKTSLFLFEGCKNI